MKKIFNLISLACLSVTLLFVSCASAKNQTTDQTSHKSSLRPVYITNSKKVNLLSPEFTTRTIDEVQLLDGTYGDTSFTLMSYTQINSKGINLSLMNEFGADMGNLSFDGETVVFDSAYFPQALPGEYIICDIQNAFYNPVELEKNYKAAGLDFYSELVLYEDGDSVEIRKIFNGKKLIEEITITDKKIEINNYLRGYKYTLLSE